jgi:hypothetical protein
MRNPLESTARSRKFVRHLYGFAILVIGALLCAPASADPPGSYRQSCTDIVSTSAVLSAKCKKTDGTVVESSVQYPDFCKTGFENDNGKLQCILPPGNYLDTCHDKTLDDGVINARCNSPHGTNVTYLIITDVCPKGPVLNIGGKLYCNYLGNSNLAASFQGSYTQSCGNISVSGTTITAICPNNSGNGVQATLTLGTSNGYTNGCLFGISNNNGTLVCNTPIQNSQCTSPGCAVPNGQTTPAGGCNAPGCPCPSGSCRRD